MSFLRPLVSLNSRDRDTAGDKAAGLGELLAAGLDVPAGWCLTADAYHAALNANRLEPQIAQRLAATEMEDPVDLEQTAEDIRAWIENAVLPDQIVQAVAAALAGLPASGSSSNPQYAVRVSRTTQDVVNPRASGLEQAFLGIAGVEAVLAHIRKIWTTPWTSRAIYFRYRRKIDSRPVSAAVVIQPMVAADAAGVMFTANPLSHAPDEIHIDATWGLGAAVIAARWTPDRFVVAKPALTILHRQIAHKPVMEVAAAEGGLQTVTVPPERQDEACLSEAQVLALAQAGHTAQIRFGAPQDIEWCRVQDRILLMQTQPLT